MTHAEHFVATPTIHHKLFSANPEQQTQPHIATPEPHILILSDDRAMRSFLRREFLHQNLRVDTCSSVTTAIEMLSARPFDLVLVDLNTNETESGTCLSQIRSSHAQDVSILMLTTRTGADDTILALDNGADDCLVKPFSLQEMQARIRSLLRRRSAPLATAAPTASLVLRADQNIVVRGNRRIQLTAREFGILDYLMANYGKTVSRADLLRDVWQTSDDPKTNLVDVYMKYLRDKIDTGDEPKLIRTVRGIGYVLSAE